jgi:hypothetical protein
MDLPNEDYTIDSFHAYLRKISNQFSQQLKLVCLVTFFPDEKSSKSILTVEQLFRRQQFEVQKRGMIHEFSTFIVDKKTGEKLRIKLYGYLSPDTHVLKCFTTDKTDDLERVLDDVVNAGGLYYLWINPTAFEELKDKLLAYPGTAITSFTASRIPSTRLSSRVRPEIKRTVTYYGEDGEETLQELKFQYGVVADVIRFRVPAHADFQISRKGVLTYNTGDFGFVIKTSDLAIDLALQSKGIFDSSRVVTIPLRTARKSLELNQFTPWMIEFQREIESDDLERLFTELQHERFAVYNSIVLKGSLHGEGTILDEVYRTTFTISVNSQRMMISPRYDTSSESFLRFFRAVVERFDPNARALAPVESQLG